MNKMKFDYFVSVVVLTFNPDKDNLFLTLRSILLQKGIRFQIVISDDASKENFFSDIERYFLSENFFDYILISNDKNQGTVKNCICALKKCTGKYVKTISPGDCFSNDDVLKNWIEFTEQKMSVVCFSDAVYYKRSARKSYAELPIEIQKVYAHPQLVTCYKKGGNAFRTAYLLLNDICVGVAIVVLLQKIQEYISIIEDKVIYAEDSLFRLMVYQNEPTSYYEKSCILYEYGSGISTRNDIYWSKKILMDWSKTNNILIDMIVCKKKKNIFDKKLLFICNNEPTDSLKYKFIKFLYVPEAFFFFLRKKIFVRLTPVEVNCNFLRQLFCEYMDA